MNHDILALVLAGHLSRAEVLSARPDAPVVPSRERPRPLTRTRGVLAGSLQRLASRVEPSPVPDAACRA